MDGNRFLFRTKTMLLRFTAILAAAALTIGAAVSLSFVTSAQADYRYHADDLWYTLDASSGKFTAVIVGFESSTGKTDATIPQKIGENGYEVSAIAPNAFAGTRISSVTVPTSVKTIGEGAFRGCTELTNANLPSGITEIPDYCFFGCTSLPTINIPSSVTRIGYEAFMNCSMIDKINISNGLNVIDQYAFTNCTHLSEIKIPDAVKSIGTGAFEGCTSLVTVVLPKELATIEDFLFHNCSSITGITIPDKVASIGNRAFSDCTHLASISIPPSVQAIGWQAFYNCTELSAVMISYTTDNISDTAFLNTNVEIWGYAGSYANNFAYRNNIPFHISGEVHNVTFSADNLYASVSNISIKKLSGEVVNPPAIIENGATLSITATAPDGYDINYVTINGNSFANGSNYTVEGRDVSIFVSYKQKVITTSAITEPQQVTTYNPPQTTTAPPPVTTSKISTMDPEVTTATAPLPEDTDDDTTITTTDDDDNPSGSYIKVDSDLQDINGEKVRIVTQKNYFLGPATIRLTNSPESYAAASSAVDSIDSENSIYYAFDISILDENGKNSPGYLASGSVTFQIPVPNELLPYSDTLRVYHIADDTPEYLRSSIIEDINGVKRVQFESNSFSPYIFIAEVGESVPVVDDEDVTTAPAVIVTDDNNGGGGNITEATTYDEPKLIDEKTDPQKNTPTQYNGNVNPHTGAIIAATVPVVTLVCVLLVRANKKRRRAKSTVE